MPNVTESACLTELGFEQPEYFKGLSCEDVEKRGLCREHTGACCDHAQPGGFCIDRVPESQCNSTQFEQPEWFKDMTCLDVEKNGLCLEHTGACCDKSQPTGTVCRSHVPESQCGPPFGGGDDQFQWHKGELCREDGGRVDCHGPFIVHGGGQPGETRPCSGYIDPRRASNNGTTVNQGLDELTLLFSEPVFSVGGGPVGPGDFIVTETGPGLVPIFVASVDATANPLIHLRLNRFLTLREWTTVRAVVEDWEGKLIVKTGPDDELNRPDRWDGGFLPCNVNQDNKCNPLDVTRFRQYFNGVAVPDCGTLEDYADINRNGNINPLDLTALRQLVFGTGPALKTWAGEEMNNSRP